MTKPHVAEIEHHEKELAIAMDPSHRYHKLPPVGTHETILDLGCGAGQTLQGLKLGIGQFGVGVDIDDEAIRFGQLDIQKKRLSHRLQLKPITNSARLPFMGDSFGMVYSRVALPYMKVNQTLREVSRVMRSQGSLWLMLHDWNMAKKMLRTAVKNRDATDVLFRLYVIANGLLFHAFGLQMSVSGKCETFQTERGMRRALTCAGFTNIQVERDGFFIMTATK